MLNRCLFPINTKTVVPDTTLCDKVCQLLAQVGGFLRVLPQALEFRTAFPHLVPPAIMVWILI